MKKGLFILCAVILCGCGVESQTGVISSISEKAFVTETDASESSVRDIYENVLSQGKMADMTELSDKYIQDYYHIDVSKLDEYVFSFAEDSKNADMLIVLKLKDVNDTDEIMAGIQGIIDQKKIELENYLPEQYNKVVNYRIAVENDVVCLVVADNPQEIDLDI